jgi:hypothetical protein
MQRTFAFSLYSSSSLAALSVLLCSLASCQDLSGQCSNRTDTLCLELSVASGTPIPDSVNLTLQSGTQSEPYSFAGIGSLLAMRAYVVEVAFDTPPPAMLVLSAQASATDPQTAKAVQLAAGPLTVAPATAARPTKILLSEVGTTSGNDLGMPIPDMAGEAPVDAAELTDMTTATGPWTLVYQLSGTPLNGLFGTTAGGTTIYAVGNSGVVIKGNGTSFTKQTATTGTGNLSGVWAADAMNVFACDRSNYAYSSQNGGTSWTASGSAGFPLNAIYGRSASEVIAVGNSPSQYFRYNAGTWATAAQPSGANLTGIFASANNYYVIGGTGLGDRIVIGTGFSALTNGSSASSQWAIAGYGTTDSFTVAVSGSGAAQYLNSGTDNIWTNMNSPLSSALNAVWVTGTNTAIVGGANNVVYQYASNNWSSISNSNLSGYTITGMWGDGGTGLWVTANNGTIGAIFKH